MKIYSKRLLSLLLAAEITASTMLAGMPVMAAEAQINGTPYTAAHSYDVTVPHVVINQVYGGGLTTDSSILVSHGFIELYNPTDIDVDLSGWSLQYADRGSNAITGATMAWQKLDLTGTIKAHSSYLVKGAATGAASPKVDLSAKGDQTWDGRFINNKGLKVTLMSNQTLLTDANPYATKPDGYVDMIGTGSNDSGSTIDGFETDYPTGSAEGTSKKKAIRRSEFADTDNNKTDFKQIDYEAAAGAALAAAVPRSSADGAWGAGAVEPLAITTTALKDGYIGSPYSAAIAASGGTAPYTYTAEGLPEGLSLTTNGEITGTPTKAVTKAAVTITATDSTAGTPLHVDKSFTITIQEAVTEVEYKDTLSISKIGEYAVGTFNSNGGVAEIVKFNKDNGKFYLVNGSGNPPSLDIVSLGSGSGQLTKEKTILVKPLAEVDGFVYGDLTSVDINTTTKRVAVSVQEADSDKPGKILVLDYDGNLLVSYAAGVQPDMIKSTADGRYILTADEAEPRTGVTDPMGSITIVDTVLSTVTHVLFDDPSVIEDGVHIRGQADPADGKIKTSGTKADAIYDLEPEYITLSADNKTAYVSLQENNAIVIIDIATNKVVAVKALGLKDYSAAANALDLLKDGQIKLENVPFKGMYMPDGIASHTINGQTYLFTANEGDVTEWPNRTNGSTIGALKASLDPNSEAAKFLNGTTAYDGVEVASDMGNDGIYMYGGRSFSIWNADTMQQVYDSGSDFEAITAARIPDYFNTSNSKTALDDRSGKKGPEPEDIKTGQVGNKVLAFVGLERIGGFMTYDVTDPANPVFANYTNSRVFKDANGKDNLDTDTGPEGLEFIPSSISPTGMPLLLVAYEVGGKVGVYQLNVTKVTVDQTSLSLKVGNASSKLTATVQPADGSSAMVIWSSSNSAVATVDSEGNVTAVAAGTATITAASADGYGLAETAVTVSASGGNTGNPGTATPTPTPTPTPENVDIAIVNGDVVKAVTTIPAAADGSGRTTATVTSEQMAAALAALDKAAGGKPGALAFKVQSNAGAGQSAAVTFGKDAIALLASKGLTSLSVNAGLGEVSFDSKAIAALTSAAGSVELTVAVSKTDASKLSDEVRASVGNHAVYELNVQAGSTAISSLNGGKARISIPYTLQAGEDSNAVMIYYIAVDGSMMAVPSSVYDGKTGQLAFTINHFSTYAVGYNNKQFNDTSSSFAKDSIVYLAARDIIGGVGNDKFAPKANMTRADFTLILARIAGASLDNYTSSSFSDVPSSAYYAKSVEWASEKGITSGIGSGKFNPQANITREQLVAMIARFAEVMGYTLPSNTTAAAFVDASSIDAFAKEAAAAVQQAGIINGKSYAGKTGSYFAPKDMATREEAAKMLAKLIQLMV